MGPSHFIGIFLALGSALTYGSADFFGGLATKRNPPFAVLASSAFIGAVLMAILALVWQENFPDPLSLFWACLAGFAGTFGLSLLYFGLATGIPIIVSPVSGIAGACLPVIFLIVVHEVPTLMQLSGFFVALPAIFLVSQSVQSNSKRSEGYTNTNLFIHSLIIGLSAGIFFGFFFICLAQIKANSFFIPLAISKSTSFLVSIIITLFSKEKIPNIFKNHSIFLSGILDPAANGLYLLSVQFTRVDIAAVLASLYPVGTILLALIIQKEIITIRQWMGMGLCLVAIVLITS